MLIEDHVRQISANAPSGKSSATMQGPQRERGLWSFLTWSFFLAQMAVGNAFAAGAAQAGSAADLNAPDSAGNSSNGANALGTPDFGAVSLGEPQPEVVPVAAAQLQANALNAAAKVGGIEQLDMTSDAGLAARAAMAQSAEASEDAQAVGEDGGSTTLPPDSSAGVIPDIDLPPIVGLPPLLDTVGDVVQGLGDTLEGALVPVVETVEDLASVLGPTLEHVLSPVSTLVDNVVDGLQSTADPLLAPVANLAEGIGGEIIEPIGSVAGEIMALADPILDAVEPVLSPIMNVVDAAEPILDPVVNAVAPVADLVEPFVQPVLEPLAPVAEPVLEILPLDIGNSGLLGGLFGVRGEADVVAGSGSLEFAADAKASGYDLFQAGTYTEFGIALQGTPAGDTAAAGELAGNVAEVVGSLLDDVTDSGNDLPSLIGSLQHEIGIRGLGEGLI